MGVRPYIPSPNAVEPKGFTNSKTLCDPFSEVCKKGVENPGCIPHLE